MKSSRTTRRGRGEEHLGGASEAFDEALDEVELSFSPLGREEEAQSPTLVSGENPEQDHALAAKHKLDLADQLERERQDHAETRRQLKAARAELQRHGELAAAVQRYELGLRGSNVTVFAQDNDLRYTVVSKPLYGRDVADLQGKTDEDVLSESAAQSVSALKREVLEKGVPLNAESRIHSGGETFWYDFHIEPMRDASGTLIGLTGAAVDITERKEAEAHLRLLMRELTHRSKNLLAVIQAMARQTARHSDSIAAFLDRFSARVHALARSHDILVAEGWHGASLNELVRSQLAQFIDGGSRQIKVEGPNVQLTPEATQSLGLALHELVTNAAKHGALSSMHGQVDVTWTLLPDDGGLELIWREAKGPKVAEPTRRGFGSMVIEYNLARALNAEVSLDFAEDGLVCRVVMPPNQIAGRH